MGSQVVVRLEARGLAARTSDSVDGWRVVVSGTAKANPEGLLHLGGMFDAIAEIEGAFSDKQSEVVRQYLGRAADTL